MKQIARMRTENREINQLQDNIIGLMNPVLKTNPELFGNFLTGVALKTGQVNMVNTGLAGKLQGWVVIRKRAQSDIWDNQDTNNNQATLALRCSANVTVDLWVW